MADQGASVRPCPPQNPASGERFGPRLFWCLFLVAVKYFGWIGLFAWVGVWVPWLALVLTDTPVVWKLVRGALIGVLVGAFSHATLRNFYKRVAPYGIPAALILAITPLGLVNAIALAVLIANVHQGALIAPMIVFFEREAARSESNAPAANSGSLVIWAEFYLSIASLFAVRYSDPMIRAFVALP